VPQPELASPVPPTLINPNQIGPGTLSNIIAFTGNNTHSGTETFTGSTVINSANAVLWAGPGATPTIDTQIAALGSNPGTVMISSTYTGPESANLTFNAVDGSLYNIYRGANNITIHDLRASTNKGYGVNYGGATIGALARFAVTQSITSPSTTTSVILGTQQVTGNLSAGGGAMASGTFELDSEGAISGVVTAPFQALNGQFAIRSTGGTLPLVIGVEGGGGVDRNAGAGGTNITTIVGVQGDGLSTGNSGTGTIQDSIGVRGFKSATSVARNNMAIVSEGDMMFIDNGCIYGENGSFAALKLLCFGIDNAATGGGNIYSTANSPAAWKYIVNGGHFNWLAGPQVNITNTFEITPSTATGGTTFSFPAFSISNAGVLGLANGTANQYLFTPAAPAAAVTISMADPGTPTVNLGFVLKATSAAFATATTAGTCVQNTTAVTGATTAMAVSVSPVSTPGVGAQWSAFVSSAGNVTINECAVAASAGGSIAFNIRVHP
jgi:hypothetical protein